MERASAKKTNEHRSGQVLSFPWGMPGLEDKEYILSILAPDSPFYYLQSVRRPGVGLLLVNPFAAFKDYEFDLDKESQALLKIEDHGQVAVFCIVNTSRGIDAATVNLMAPIVINIQQLLGKQVVLNDKRYSIRTPLPLKKAADREER